jgi:isopentenyl diphosphate isomerase/L-lactate dehydrogenase-like FMN-dependent dehydrogenase
VAAAGEKGVGRVLDIYEQEIKQTLALLGAGSVDELDSSFVSIPHAWRDVDVQPHS